MRVVLVHPQLLSMLWPLLLNRCSPTTSGFVLVAVERYPNLKTDYRYAEKMPRYHEKLWFPLILQDAAIGSSWMLPCLFLYVLITQWTQPVGYLIHSASFDCFLSTVNDVTFERVSQWSMYFNDVTYHISIPISCYSFCKSEVEPIESVERWRRKRKNARSHFSFFSSTRSLQIAKITLVPAIFSLVTRQHKSARS